MNTKENVLRRMFLWSLNAVQSLRIDRQMAHESDHFRATRETPLSVGSAFVGNKAKGQISKLR